MPIAVQAFELFDSDGDGAVTPEEFVKATTALGFGGTTERMLKRALEADLDGNGLIGASTLLVLVLMSTDDDISCLLRFQLLLNVVVLPVGAVDLGYLVAADAAL